MSVTETITALSPIAEKPNAPHTTPVNEGSLHDKPDLSAVNNALAPIQEDLNEAAEEAMYPTVPAPTPVTFSPAPSVVLRGRQRSRGLSILNERLAHFADNGPTTSKGGVREGNVWAEEVMEYVEQALKRLRQLAEDEKDVSGGAKKASIIFKERLEEALATAELGFEVKVHEASEV
ncbi:uncharacterized protein EI97DRAFT_137671 [Westerdykella ornata]|uniref:Uncharacterized protein n=1 Tax=Westerdykella ornata TaxID=318751 RepID=A0A6A6JBS2_WESOR|nr:uncharacterized protein EI97DRAFT_137671 [Westerdykella ornata]KAF2273882.1 hypothetical protein EI97DRAFT_137671 [Westerdykella ornata]